MCKTRALVSLLAIFGASTFAACGGKVIIEEVAATGSEPDASSGGGGAGGGGGGSTLDASMTTLADANPPPSMRDAGIIVPPPSQPDAGNQGVDAGFTFPFDAGVDNTCLGCAATQCSSSIEMCEADAACQAALATTSTCIAAGGDFMTCAEQSFLSNPSALQFGLAIAQCIQTSTCTNACNVAGGMGGGMGNGGGNGGMGGH